jgi:competence protein ComEA
MSRRFLWAAALLACVTCAAPAYPQASQAPAQVKIPDSERLDVNRASLTELEKLPGMTQIWAERIVRFRPYHSKLDLVNKGIIPPHVYHKIEPFVVAHRDPQ